MSVSAQLRELAAWARKQPPTGATLSNVILLVEALALDVEDAEQALPSAIETLPPGVIDLRSIDWWRQRA